MPDDAPPDILAVSISAYRRDPALDALHQAALTQVDRDRFGGGRP
jgi:hypothetical protein